MLSKTSLLFDRVHPVAAIFRMLLPDDLRLLADDILANGQSDPIVLAKDGNETVLVDGRNRVAACELAGVDPAFVMFPFDPKKGTTLNEQITDFILSKNVNRRHDSKGALAMAVAMVFPESDERGRGKKSAVTAHFPMVPQRRIQEARIVLKHAPDLADLVRLNEMSLPEAYEEARQLKAKAEGEAEKRAKIADEAPDLVELAIQSLPLAMERLEQRKREAALLKTIKYPDLVEAVESKHITIQDALAAGARRDEEDRSARQGATRLLAEVVSLLNIEPGDPSKRANDLMKFVDPKLWPPERIEELSSEHLRACAAMLETCAKLRAAEEVT